MEQNCLRYNNKTRKFFIRYEPIEQCFTSLAEMILLIQAEGDYEKAKDFVDMYRDLTPGIKEIIARLKDAPTDITPKYTF